MNKKIIIICIMFLFLVFCNSNNIIYGFTEAENISYAEDELEFINEFIKGMETNNKELNTSFTKIESLIKQLEAEKDNMKKYELLGSYTSAWTEYRNIENKQRIEINKDKNFYFGDFPTYYNALPASAKKTALFNDYILYSTLHTNLKSTYNSIATQAFNINNRFVPIQSSVSTWLASTEGQAALAAATSADWWGKAMDFFRFSTTTTPVKTTALDSLTRLLEILGNAVIIIVTIILGIKYMFGSVEGKTDVKQGLITLFIAMLFFYGGTSVYDLFVTGGNLSLVGDTAEGTIFNIYSTIIYFAKFAAIGGIIYIGVKYMFAGAEGKADLKGKGAPFFIGVIMVFATLSFLSVIQKIIADII